DLPLAVTFTNNLLTLRNRSNEEIPRLIIFENRKGKIGYRIVDSLSGEITSERPALDKNLDALIRDLRQALDATCLDDKQADAVIKPWKDSWFEQGMRVFYMLPRRITDATLPLQIDPQPAELVRVLVGRTEVITPEMEQSVKKQVSKLNDASPKIREEAR